MKRSTGRGLSNLPVPKTSKGSPSTASSHLARGRGNIARSAEDLPCQVNLSVSGGQGISTRRAVSPGSNLRKGLSPVRTPTSQPGVRYITEDMIKKMAKEDNFDMITTLSLTLGREGGKKIKYIENLERLKKLHTLNLSNNMIEKMEKLDKLLRLRDLNLSHNSIVKIEGIENLVFLQTLNLSWNQIEHIPPWIGKKLKALRNFNLGHNQLASLNELSKLKPIPDLTQLDVSGTPLSELPHSRLYIVFHLRTVATLDAAHVTAHERDLAQQRFAQGELEKLEKQLEQEEVRSRRLEESHNKSLQEKSLQEANTKEMKVKDMARQGQVSELQRELEVKNDLLKKKTSELNKACEKHYQLEQELAFYKIDSKFHSLSEVPRPQILDDDDDNSGLLDESPYIGRARYKANQYSQEGSLLATPQKIQIHSIASSPATPAQRPEALGQYHQALTAQVVDKQREIQLAEDRLQSLQSNLSATEDKLVRATQELKKMSERKTPEPFRDDNKYKIRQRLAKKMKTVNEMRDSATQMETEIDRRQQKVQENKGKVARLKEQITHLNTGDPSIPKKKAEMVDKEQQISEDNHVYSELQNQLQDMLQTVARETADIKKLEQQLNEERIEANEELRQELDDVVDGLQGYLQNVKDQSVRQKEDFEQVVKEKEGLEERVRRLDAELKIIDREAEESQAWQKRLGDTEQQLQQAHDLNKSLNDQLHRSRQLDPELQDRLEHAEMEARNLRRSLNDTEKRSQTERKNLEKQLQVERGRAEQLGRQQKDGGRGLEDLRRMEAQLEAAKGLNASLRDQLSEARKQSTADTKDTFRPSDLKKRLKDLTYNFRAGKGPLPPQGSEDVLGKTFHDLHHYVQDKLNKSGREVEEARKNIQKASVEVQTLKENLKRTEADLAKRGEKKDPEKMMQRSDRKNEEAEISRLEEEIRRLKKALQDAENRARQERPRTRITYAPSSDSDRASSLNSEEKALYDELQRELMELRRNMRNQEEESERRVLDAENEIALLTEEMQQREEEFEKELEKQRQEAELIREKQEARIQVIADDLDQAQQSADHLQGLLESREGQMQEDMQEADMSNQMMVAQEEELTRLYDILDAQKEEMENLNQMLDYLAQQGPEGVGPGFDDELWRIRQEVNNLKETLAMQSAYVQTMPLDHAGASGMATQAGVGAGAGAGAAPPYRQPPVLPQPTMYAQQFAPPGSALVGPAPPSIRPTAQPPTRPASSPPQALAPQSSPPGRTSAPLLHSSPGHDPLLHSSPGQSQAASGHGSIPPPSSMSIPIMGGNLGTHLSSPPRIHMLEHLGTERRESKAPPGGKPSSGRPTESTPVRQSAPPGAEVDDADRLSQRSGRAASRIFGRNRAQTRRKASQPSAFEPVYRPQPHHAQYHSPPPPGFHPADPSMYVGGTPAQPGRGETGVPSWGVPTSPGIAGPSHGVPIQSHVVSGGHPMPGSAPGRTLGHVEGTYAPIDPSAPPQGFVPVASQTDPRVAFDPVNMEYSYPVGYPEGAYPGVQPGYSGVQPGFYPYPPGGVPVPPGGYSVGQQVYVPTGPAQSVGYQPGRVYYSAGGKTPVRIYYPANGRIPMPSSGPPPPPGMHSVGVISPGPRPGSMPVTPVATGTPISDSRLSTTVNFDGSFITPPSPIRPVAMESPVAPRGILKNGGNGVAVDDDSYLFCNVPEHHDLEDYIAELQEKLRKVKIKISHQEDIHEEIMMDEEKRLIHRLKGELEDRRDELEGLDLAIERQKKSLRKLKYNEKSIREKRSSAKEELDFLRTRNMKNAIRSKQRKYEDDDSLDESACRSRQTYLQDEIACLEKTLAKRTGQLREADKLLKECNADLKDAREQARDTVKKYDTASVNLQTTALEAKELEKRATEAGIQLVKTQDQLGALRTEVRGLERKREKQEKLLREVMQVLAKKDSEFKEIDSKLKMSTKSLHRVSSELKTSQMKEKETVDALRDSDDILSKRRMELSRLRDQYSKVKSAMASKLDGQRSELEKLDQTMGKKKTELQLMTEAMERRQTDLSSVLREAEAEITSKHRELRDQREHIKTTEQQKLDILTLIKSKRAELARLKGETEQEDEVLQRLISSVNKHKTELKHVYEMQKYEQTELENLKAQHNQKIAELEKTQRALLEEKSELEQLNTETNRKSSEVERLRQTLERERQEVDHLTMEKQALEDRISTLVRERDMLNENCKTLDDKLNQMKRNHRIMDEKIESSSDRLERVESELRQREREMDDSNHQRSLMQKDVSSLKQNVKESRTELQTLEENIQESEEHLRQLEQNLREAHSQRDEAKVEIERLNEAIRTTRFAHEEALRQEKSKQAELQDLLHTYEHHDVEYQTARQALSKVRQEMETEENKLNRLVSNANIELDTLHSELSTKHEELASVTQEINSLKTEATDIRDSGEKFVEMDKKIKELEREVSDRNDEKKELAKALTMSYEELQKLRQDTNEEQERLNTERAELQNTLRDVQEHLETTKQEMALMQSRSTGQVSELQDIAEEHYNRANRLNDDLSRLKREVLSTKKQLLSQDMLNIRLVTLEEALRTREQTQSLTHPESNTPSDSHDSDQSDDPTPDPGPTPATPSLHPLEVQSRLQAHMLDIRHMLATETDNCTDNKENRLSRRDVSISFREEWRKEALKDKLLEEQDYLRHQLRQQMLRHAESMESTRLQSEGTIESLKRKLNTLQEVLFNNNNHLSSDIHAIHELTRSRSNSPSRSPYSRNNSQSPRSRFSYLANRRSRSRSSERLSPLIPERDLM
ncbi:centriolin-like [Haliotis cracherodii]|uniref:centriolin-like n=1 Tax=Haliotis cracherodii TaxID=6455 RepID=UPI0039EA028E